MGCSSASGVTAEVFCLLESEGWAALESGDSLRGVSWGEAFVLLSSIAFTVVAPEDPYQKQFPLIHNEITLR